MNLFKKALQRIKNIFSSPQPTPVTKAPVVQNQPRPTPQPGPAPVPVKVPSNMSSKLAGPFKPGTSSYGTQITNTPQKQAPVQIPQNTFQTPTPNISTVNRPVDLPQQTSVPSATLSTPAFSAPSFTDRLNNIKQSLGQFKRDVSKPTAGEWSTYNPFVKGGSVATPDLGVTELIRNLGNAVTKGAGAFELVPRAGAQGEEEVKGAAVTDYNQFQNKPLPSQNVADTAMESKRLWDEKQKKLTNEGINLQGKIDTTIFDTKDPAAAFENTDNVYGWDKGYEKIVNDYQAGTIDDNAFLKQQAEYQQKQSEDIYNSLEAEQRATIPEYESYLNTEKSRLESELPGYKAEAEAESGRVSNIYEDIVRKMVGAKGEAATKMKNVFSALGTAESSAFIDKMGALEQSLGSEIGKTELEKGGKLAGIERDLSKINNDTKNKIDSLIANKNSQVRQVLTNVNATKEQKASKLSEINMNLTEALRGVKTGFNDAKRELLLLQQSNLEGRKNIFAQGQVDINAQNNLARLQEKLNAVVPKEQDSDINELGRPYSSMLKSSARANLKSKYPGLEDLIDKVYLGQSTPEALRQAISSLGVK